MNVTDWILVLIAAFILGMAKAGLKGIEILNVTLMALVFGGKTSTGVVLPLLCVADIMAVIYYKRHVQWPQFWKLIPWMMAGVLLGVFVGKNIDEVLFKKMLAIIILATVFIIVFMELKRVKEIPKDKFFIAATGLTAGFTTMLGNLAGAFANIYFLAMRLTKNDFIGTAAWVFLVINLFKLPFQVIFWNNITPYTLRTDLFLLPAMIAGFGVGLKVVALIKDDSYRKVVIALTIVGAVVILVR